MFYLVRFRYVIFKAFYKEFKLDYLFYYLLYNCKKIENIIYYGIIYKLQLTNLNDGRE